MKKALAMILCIIMLFSFGIVVFAENGTKTTAESEISADSPQPEFDLNVKSAVLMEASTGKILYAKNENSAMAPASVTKIMTLLLAAEALAAGNFKLEDKVVISEYAASMGGSQVFLEEGEEITVEELFKSTIIASANDSAVALAELVSGSESIFVSKMNAKAMELSMSSTNFENVTGLDDTTVNHVTSALDIAIMSRELIKHDIITKYSSLWQDSIRNGEFILTNTNRLVRYYDGCNGLKTGSTDKAGFCMSASAKRDGMQLIAVVMGADTRDLRNNAAKTLLDYGFSSFSLYERAEERLEDATILGGTVDSGTLYSAPFSVLIAKGARVECEYQIPNELCAPIEAGQSVGKVIYKIGEEIIGESDVYLKESVGKIGYFELYTRLIMTLFGKC